MKRNKIIHKQYLVSLIYLIGYLFILVLDIFRNSNINSIINLSSIYTYSLILLIIINLIILMFRKISFNDLIVPVILIITFSFALLFYKIKIIPLTLLLLYLLLKNADLIKLKLFVIWNVICIIFSFLLIVSLGKLGVIPEQGTSNIIGSLKGNSLGFTHPNITGNIVISILLAIFIVYDFLRENNKSDNNVKYFVAILVSFLISYPLYKITNCRTIIVFEIIMLFFLFIIKLSFIDKSMFMSLIPVIIFISLIVIYLAYEYNGSSEIWVNLNGFLSNRLNMQKSILTTYPIHLFQFPNNVPLFNGTINMEGTTLTVDNSFISILETCGIVGFIFSDYILCKCAFFASKVNEYILCSLILAVVLSSCMESTIFDAYFYAPFLYSAALYDKYEFIKKENEINEKR